MEFSAKQIAALLEGEIVGDPDVVINNLAKIEEGSEGCISFLANMKYEPFIYSSRSSVIIVSKNFVPKQEIKSTLIVVSDPYLSFTVLLQEYQRLTALIKTGIEEPSFTGSNTTIGADVYRGAFSYVGQNCVIGSNVKIYPHVYVGDGVSIGDNTILHPGVKIYSGCKIGNFCTIAAGVVIGSDGFGFAPQPDGSYKNIPQLGIVILEDHVDIGANTTIDRATMGATIIHQGVKLDNLIQIAHNVEIGRNTVMASQSGISGSTKIGEGCIIAGQVGIVGHIKVANKTSIGAQSGISKSVDKEGTSWFGSPAIDFKDQLKSMVVYKKLPEMLKKIEEMERKLSKN
jgi:UDP-3-O-[3-hydroxymyristoyl] glucosamine N-acyltransferase